MTTRIRLVACMAAAGLGVAACQSQPAQHASTTSNGAGATVIVGAGSTFDNPFFSSAFYAYNRQHPGVTVNYQSIGSGGGIEQFTKKTVDFGATDVPMNAKELSAVEGGAQSVVQLPVTLGGVAIAYNLPGAPKHLRLSPNVLADIFLGKATRWNDPEIAALNPGAGLPNLPIVVVHRADGSGTTYIFTDYLSTVSAEWKAKVGKSKTVSWPAASSVGMKGNEGVAGQIKNTPGAVGYVELAYALETGMSFGSIRNKAGDWVLPSIASVRSAAAEKPNVTATDFSIVDEPGNASYPIAGYSWVLLYRNVDASKRTALCPLFSWLLSEGQRYASAVDYVGLPANVESAALEKLGSCP